MRKLVKKLALVLALVLALGCIAPASAQAAEVRRSWNFAPDEYKPTHSMTVGDDYSFELYDQGDAIDPSIYDVAYYSKSDALAMSKSTGYAVAVAAAEDVKICAVVTNKVTGNTAKVWGLVDIAAKVVETTPTATEAPTATPTEAPFALIDAAQYSKNQIVLTFNKDAADVVKSDLTIKYSLTENSSARYNCYIKGTPSVSGNTVTITLYSALKDKSFAYVSYKNSTPIAFPVSVGDVASIAISTTQVQPEDDSANIKVKLFDGNKVLLEELSIDKEMPKGAYCELNLTGAEDENGDEIAYATYGGIYFHEIGNYVLATVDYHTGEFDDEGNELILSDSKEIECIDTTPIVTNSVWSVTTKAVSKFNEANYKENDLCVGDTNFRLAGKVTISTPRVNQSNKTDTKYTEKDNLGKDLVYESSDNTIVLVDNEGKLIPVSAGSADIIVRFESTWDEETGEEVLGDVVGVANVVVKAKRELARITTDYSKTTTVSTKEAASDKVTIKVTGYDQWGDAYALTTDDVTLVQITESTALSNIALEGASSAFVSESVDKGAVKVTIKGYGAEAAKDGTYRFRIECGKFKTNAFAVAFKAAKTTPSSYKFASNKDSVEVKVQKESDLLSKAPVVVLDAWAYDASKVKMNTVDIVGQVDKEDKTVTAGTLWYDVTVPSGVDKTVFVADALTLTNGALHFDPLKNRPANYDDTWAPDAWKVGTYTFTLYVFSGSYRVADTKTITITNGQESISASLDNITSEYAYATVMTGTSIGTEASGKFTATKASCAALFSAVLKDTSSDTVYCVELKDGNTKIDLANGTYNITDIAGYADGKNTVVITEITLTKKYDGGVTKVLKATVSAGTITFAE